MPRAKNLTQQSESHWVRATLTVLLVIGVALSVYALHAERVAERGLEPGGLCSLVATSDCSRVLTSAYARWFGVPLPVYSIGFYLLIGAVLWLVRNGTVRQATALYLTTLGVLVSFALFLVTRLVLRTVCPVCYSMYTINVLLFAIVVASYHPVGRILSGAWKGSRGFRNFVTASLALFLLALLLGLPRTPTEASTAGEAASPLSSRVPPKERALETARRYYNDLLQAGRTRLQPGLCTTLYGDPSAPVHIWEFSDFQCPYCRLMSEAVEAAIQRYGNKIYIEYCHYPLDPACNPSVSRAMHPLACRLAAIAECAADQGMFLQVHNEIFRYQPQIEAWLKGSIPGTLGGALFQACAENSAILQRIRLHIQLAQQLNIRGTPTLFLNGLRIPSAIRTESFLLLIQFELEAAQRH